MVDNVVASVHSEWFLDAAFGRMGFTALLPSAYQVKLSACPHSKALIWALHLQACTALIRNACGCDLSQDHC